MKAKISSILFIAAILMSSVAIAQRPNGYKNQQERVKQFSPKEDFLTDEQKETIKQLRLETEKELKPLKNQLREAMAHQQTLTTADEADLKAINKNIDKMSELKAEMAKIKAKQHQAFRAQLTEEQLIRFDNRKNKMKHEIKNRRPGDRADGRSNNMHRRGV